MMVYGFHNTVTPVISREFGPMVSGHYWRIDAGRIAGGSAYMAKWSSLIKPCWGSSSLRAVAACLSSPGRRSAGGQRPDAQIDRALSH